jgi:ribulose-5-phosphate 4-epimerase/fuculose-1-phosphate aldolase
VEFPITNEYFQEEAINAGNAVRMIVLANRILANEGVFDAFGHISVRNPENPETFFISRAISPEFITREDMLELDFEGRIVSGNPSYRPFGERAIHCAIYKRRPDVHCVCHPHPYEIIPFASTGIPLRSIYHQDVTFYEGLPTYSDMPPACGLLINTLEEGEKLADALGDKRGVLIRNHGVVVVGESVPRVVYSSVTLRDSAKILLSTLAMGVEPHYIGREEAEQGTYVQFCGQGLQRSWNYWCQKAKQTFPDIAELEH